jgi:hypothetical protein
MNTLQRQLTAGALSIAVFTLTFIALGCGNHEVAQTATTGSGGDAIAAEAPSGKIVVASVSDTAQHVVEGGEKLSASSLPPDVDAAAADSLVVPGSVVEISAIASPDVVDMGLSDGLGKEQPFAYDSTMKVWRVFYRVPIRTTRERIGLSVTATNDGNRWRRVWVFLDVQH